MIIINYVTITAHVAAHVTTYPNPNPNAALNINPDPAPNCIPSIYRTYS